MCDCSLRNCNCGSNSQGQKCHQSQQHCGHGQQHCGHCQSQQNCNCQKSQECEQKFCYETADTTCSTKIPIKVEITPDISFLIDQPHFSSSKSPKKSKSPKSHRHGHRCDCYDCYRKSKRRH